MYAVMKTGGKQYKVSPGDIVRIEKIEGKTGEIIEIKDVLLFVDNDRMETGKPFLENGCVVGEIVDQGRSKKIIVFKAKRRKGYRKKQGHRQQYTGIKIKDIKAG
ncbi:MAG: 50S ribosomal protein L21 [Thermodesulfobacteriota bacterium]|nr:50S ribosomal protein L21 [Thermodesulfobacteriota bacterium]